MSTVRDEEAGDRTAGAAMNAPHVHRAARRRRPSTLAMGLADQVLCSGSNLLLSVLIARASSPRGFGAFGVAFIVYLAAQTLGRGCVGGVASLRLATLDRPDFRRQAAGGLSAAVGLGLLLGALVGAVLLAGGGGSLRSMLLVLVPALAILVPQDCLRYLAFAAHRPWIALVNDAAWLASLLVLLVVLFAIGRPGGVLIFAAWSCSASVGVVVAALLLEVRVRPAAARQWWRDHGSLIRSLTLEYLLISGVAQGAPLLVGATSGVGAVGAMRAAQTTFGPVTATSAGLSLAIVPRVSRKWSTLDPKFYVDLVAVGTTLALGSLAWAAFILLVPGPVGAGALGASWLPGRHLAVVTGVALGAGYLAVPAVAGLRILGRNWIAARARAVLAPISLVAVLIGATANGAMGATIGLASGAGLSVVVTWVLFAHYYKRAIAATKASRAE